MDLEQNNPQFIDIVAPETGDGPRSERVRSFAMRLIPVVRMQAACWRDYELNAFFKDDESLSGIALFKPSLEFIPEFDQPEPETPEEEQVLRFEQSRADLHEAGRDLQNALDRGAAVFSLGSFSVNRAHRLAQNGQKLLIQ